MRAAFERYRAKAEKPPVRPLANPTWIPTRHWTCFYLARALGNLGDAASLDSLVAALEKEPAEASLGRPDPSEPNIHFLQPWRMHWQPTVGCWHRAFLKARLPLEGIRPVVA